MLIVSGKIICALKINFKVKSLPNYEQILELVATI